MPILPKPTGGNFKPCPEGNHIAACYRIIDFGTQKNTFKGKEKEQHQILISWEIPDEKMDDGRPFTINGKYTWSMSEKANLRKALESWRGKPFVEADFETNGFDIKNILGAGCMLNVVHRHDDGNTYTDIKSVARLPKGIVAPKPINPFVFVWLTPDEFSNAAYQTLSDKLKDVIDRAPEYQAILHPGAQPVVAAGEPEFEDEIPF